MKQFLFPVLTLAILLTFSSASFAQRVKKNPKQNKDQNTQTDSDRPGPGGPGGPGFRMTEFFEKAKTDDGRVEIAKLLVLMSEETQKSLTEADKNGDGLLNQEEMKEVPFLGRPMGPGGPGGPDGMRGILADARTDNGKIDLSKLPETVPDQLKTALTEADKNGDGFLSKAEQNKLPFLSERKAPKERRGAEGRERRRPENRASEENGARGPMKDPFADARTEEGQIDLSKLSEEMPERFANELSKADQDQDGFLSQEEQKELPFFNRRSRGPEGAPGNRPNSRDPKARPENNGFAAVMEKAKTEDGQIDIAKWVEGTRENQAKMFTALDKDGNGFLDENEQKSFIPPRRPRSEEKKAE